MKTLKTKAWPKEGRQWPDEIVLDVGSVMPHDVYGLYPLTSFGVLYVRHDVATAREDQGRKEGREQGIRESAERVMKTPYTSADNYGGYSLKEPVDILMSAKAMCLSLLTQPSPKEQEK